MRLLILSLAAVISGAQDWPQFRGNAPLTGVTGAGIPATLKVLWTFEAGDAIESSAAIAGDTVYLGTQASELVALDLANGKPRWRFKTKEGIGESSAAVGQGFVFVGDLAGTLYAVNAKDGSQAWTYSTGGEIKASPVIVDDRVIVGSYEGSLTALA